MPISKIIKKILKRVTKEKDKKLSIPDLSDEELIRALRPPGKAKGFGTTFGVEGKHGKEMRRDIQELYEGGRKGSLRETPAVDETSRFIAELTDTSPAKETLKSTNGFSVRSRNPRGKGYKPK
jgi:hypothetical protein